MAKKNKPAMPNNTLFLPNKIRLLTKYQIAAIARIIVKIPQTLIKTVIIRYLLLILDISCFYHGVKIAMYSQLWFQPFRHA